MKRSVAPGTRGFTLIELAIALVVLGLLAMLAVALLPKLTDRMRLDHTKVDETEVNKAVVGFALAHNRLPCPDTNNNGLEGGATGNCAATDVVGTLPYRSMGLPGPALDEARLPLRYGVFRDAADGADLAALTELFEPALPDKLTITAGTATQCNQTSATPVTTITYYSPPPTTLRVQVLSGTFKKDDLVGYVHLDYNNLQTVTPPAPSTATPGGGLICSAFPVCPCGVTGAGSGATCTTCNGFHAGNTITSDTSTDIPLVRDLKYSSSSSSGTLIGFPGNGAAVSSSYLSGPSSGFSSGDTIQELYVPAVPNSCKPNRNITDYNGNPTTTTELLTGVSAKVTGVQSNQAHVADDPISGPGYVDLPIDQISTVSDLNSPNYGDPTDPFQPGDIIYASPSGAVGKVISETTDHTTFLGGETVVDGSTGGSAVIQSGSITGYSFIVDGSITGTIAVGDTITGQSSGAKATVAKVDTGTALLVPTVTHGHISFAATTVQYTNELDFCQAIRNAIGVTESSPAFGSSGGVYTVNPDGVTINPAYLLVSGGVEDANGNGGGLNDFDQRNELSTLLDFESPGRLRNSSSNPAQAYDDVVSTMQMKVLAERLKCARNIGAVNALAVDATVERNLEEMAFQQNEEALTNVQFTYASLQLAQVDENIKAVELLANAIELSMEVYKAIEDAEGAAALIPVAGAIASLVSAIAELAVADQAVTNAQNDYAGACTNQQATASALSDAIPAANNALDRAVRADAWGGVQ